MAGGNWVALWKVSERTSAPKAAPGCSGSLFAALAELSDDRQAGAVDAECGDVHAQALVVVGEGSGGDGEEGIAGCEQYLDGVGRDASVCEVAGFVLAGGRHRSDQDLEQLVELGGRRDGDGDGSGDLGAHFVGEVVVGDADGVWLSGSTDGGVDDRVSQGARDDAVVVTGGENRLANDQVVRQFHPDDDVRAVGFVAVLHDEGSGEATADPLTGRR